MFAKRPTHLIFVFLLITYAVSAQTSATTPNATESTDQKSTDASTAAIKHAYGLLDDILKYIQRFRLAENRTYLYAIVGDLLWDHDKQAAIAVFKDSAADLRAVFAEKVEGDEATAIRQRMATAQLREKVLFVMAKHDGRMALDLLAETRPLATSKEQPQVDSEAELETRIASIIAENDPTHALLMARKSLAKGFSVTLPALLAEIRRKDNDAAVELAGDILAKLKTATLVTNQEASNVAIRVFEMATDESDAATKAGAKKAKPLLSENSIRELAELIAAAALTPSAENGGQALNVGSIMAQLKKYAPSRAQQLSRLNPISTDEQSGDHREWQTFQTLVATGSADELISAAEKAGPGMREAYLREAVLKLANNDKINEARQLINEHISDPDVRRQMLSELDKKVLMSAAVKGRMEETRKLLSSAKSNEERIAILTQLATAIAEKGDTKAALKILEEARTLVSASTRYSRHLLARLQIANAYTTLDAQQSLAILEPLIDQLNELIGAGILLGEFFGEEEFVRDDELLILFVNQLAEVFQQQFGKNLARLTTSDFAGTRGAADRFQRFEVRIMARLLVAQSVLTSKENTNVKSIDATEGAKPSNPEETKTEPVVVP